MILSAMMFALGFLVSGLLWLGLSVALVRRAQRLTERRLRASISTRRAEFEAERDELRARHAVEMYRIEREVGRILDTATAHRLEADVKEQDIVSLRAEIAARIEDLQDMQLRLAVERENVQDLERRHAEAGSALRATRHALETEKKRRLAAEEALSDAGLFTDERRMQLSALRVENESLKAMLAERTPQVPAPPPARVEPAVDAVPQNPEPAQSASIVPLPTRSRPQPDDPADQAAGLMAEATRDLQRLAGEAHADFGRNAWRAPAHAEPRMPIADDFAGTGVLTELDLHRTPQPAEPQAVEGAEGGNPETRFFEALAEIRALKRSASQAGE